MRQVRTGTFETNSSSTHTLVIMSKEDYEKFRNGELFLDGDNPITKEELISRNKEEIEKIFGGDFDEFVHDERLDYDSIMDTDYETFYQAHTTKNGEEIVAFGYYGYDG